jgi:hypothetical protein
VCESITIPNMTGPSPVPAGIHTDTRSSKLYQPSRTPDFAYLLVSSISFSFSSPMSLFLIHRSTIIAEHKVISSLSISPCHDHELSPSVQLFTECSIHRVQHTPSTAYPYDCLSSLHSQDYELTPERSFGFQRVSLQIDRHQPAVHKSFKGKVTSSHSLGF